LGGSDASAIVAARAGIAAPGTNWDGLVEVELRVCRALKFRIFRQERRRQARAALQSPRLSRCF